MRWINKQSAPSSFQDYKRQNNATYEDLDRDVKTELRDSLLAEQFGVCAYCQKKLVKDIKIEHHCERSICNGKDGTIDRTLDYTNLLAVCIGKGGRENDLHCDTKKATLDKNKGLPMTINPLNQSHIKTITYSSTGLIHSSIYEEEINTILNLNILYLKNMRKEKWLMIFKYSRSKNGTINKNKMVKLLESDLTKKFNQEKGYDEYANNFPGLSEYMMSKFCQ